MSAEVADGSSAPRKLTAGTAMDSGPRWAPDSASVCFWSDRTGSVHGHDFAVAIADPDRLGIGGDSRGGFMAAWAIGQTDRFGAALMSAGISDWGMLGRPAKRARRRRNWAAAAAGKGQDLMFTTGSAPSRSSPGLALPC